MISSCLDAAIKRHRALVIFKCTGSLGGICFFSARGDWGVGLTGFFLGVVGVLGSAVDGLVSGDAGFAGVGFCAVGIEVLEAIAANISKLMVRSGELISMLRG